MMKYRRLFAVASAGALAASLPGPASAQELYLGQIIEVGFTFCPRNTLSAEGQMLAISSNSALFALLGTTYGGDGRTTFALPDLRGRTSIGQGQGPGLQPYTQGQQAGTESVTLTVAQMPSHNHTGRMVADKDVVANKASPSGNALARSQESDIYSDVSNVDDPMKAGTIQTDPQGGSQPHENRQPLLVTRFCVVTAGIFPSHP